MRVALAPGVHLDLPKQNPPQHTLGLDLLATDHTRGARTSRKLHTRGLGAFSNRLGLFENGLHISNLAIELLGGLDKIFGIERRAAGQVVPAVALKTFVVGAKTKLVLLDFLATLAAFGAARTGLFNDRSGHVFVHN